MIPLTYTTDQLCAELQCRDKDALRRLLTQWEAHGFPKRLPYQSGQPARWSRPAVESWLQNWGKPQTTHSGTPAAINFETLRKQAEARHTHQ